MSDKNDSLVAAARSSFERKGWKKHAWMHYKFFGMDKQIIISASFETDKAECLDISLTPHLVALNQLSHFTWEYGKKYKGLFSPMKLSVGANINDYRACLLFRSIAKLQCRLEAIDEGVDAASSRAETMFDAELGLDHLEKVYSSAGIFRGPLLYILLHSNQFARARQILIEDGVSHTNRNGDGRSGVLRYIDENGLDQNLRDQEAE